MEKARHEGVALSSVLKLATKAFVDGNLDIQLVDKENMKAQAPVVHLKGKSAKRLDRRVGEGMREYKKGNIESMEAFLKREYPDLHKAYGD